MTSWSKPKPRWHGIESGFPFWWASDRPTSRALTVLPLWCLLLLLLSCISIFTCRLASAFRSVLPIISLSILKSCIVRVQRCCPMHDIRFSLSFLKNWKMAVHFSKNVFLYYISKIHTGNLSLFICCHHPALERSVLKVNTIIYWRLYTPYYRYISVLYKQVHRNNGAIFFSWLGGLLEFLMGKIVDRRFRSSSLLLGFIQAA